MLVYFTNLFWVVILGVIAERYSVDKYNKVLGKNYKAPNIIYIIFLLFLLMSIYALRWKTGTDSYGYYKNFFYIGQQSVLDLIGKRDWGFSVLTAMIYKLFSGNYIIYNYILAAITYIPVILILKKYSSDFLFTIFLYITIMAYYWPFNGVRQSIACSICFASSPLLYEKKYIKYCFWVGIAFLFHSTALIMIPLILIVTNKSWSIKIIIFSVFFIISIIFLPSIWSVVISAIDMIGQQKMVNDYGTYNINDNGANIFRILVAFAPVVISFIYYKKIKKNNDKVDLIINMSLMGALFMLAAGRITILARFSNYFICFQVLLIPEFTVIFTKDSRRLYRMIVCLLYFIYMCNLLPLDSDLLPYKFIFNYI